MAKRLADYRVLQYEDNGEIKVYDYYGNPAPVEIAEVIIKHFKKVN